MSLSEKALQLENLANGVMDRFAGIAEFPQKCEGISAEARGIIGDLPAADAVNGAWDNARQAVNAANEAVQGARAKMVEVAERVRNAGSAG